MTKNPKRALGGLISSPAEPCPETLARAVLARLAKQAPGTKISNDDLGVLVEEIQVDTNRQKVFGLEELSIDELRVHACWRVQFLRTHFQGFAEILRKRPELERCLLYDLWKYYLPFANRLIALKKAKASDRGFVVGISAIQGAGKTVHGEIMELVLGKLGYAAISLSIDDHYVTHAQLNQLRKRDPRFILRGLTHDLDLAKRDLTILRNFEGGRVELIANYYKGAHKGDGDRYRWVGLRPGTTLMGVVLRKRIWVNKKLQSVPVLRLTEVVHQDREFEEQELDALAEGMGGEIPLVDQFLPQELLEFLTETVETGQFIRVQWEDRDGKPHARFEVEPGMLEILSSTNPRTDSRVVDKEPAVLRASVFGLLVSVEEALAMARQANKKEDRNGVKLWLSKAKAAVEEAHRRDKGRSVSDADLHHSPVDNSLIQTVQAYVELLADFETAFELAKLVLHSEEHGEMWRWLIPQALQHGVAVRDILPHLRFVTGVWNKLPLLERIVLAYQREILQDRQLDLALSHEIQKAQSNFDRVSWVDEMLRDKLSDQLERVQAMVPPTHFVSVPLKDLPTGWRIVDQKPDFIFYDGWMLMARPVDDERIFESGLPGLTQQEHVKFAKLQNQRLNEYEGLWRLIDYSVVLYVPNYQMSIRWRDQQERELRALGRGMSREQIKAFVHYFWRSVHPGIYRYNLMRDTENTDQIVLIGDDHTFGSVIRPEDAVGDEFKTAGCLG